MMNSILRQMHDLFATFLISGNPLNGVNFVSPTIHIVVLSRHSLRYWIKKRLWLIVVEHGVKHFNYTRRNVRNTRDVLIPHHHHHDLSTIAKLNYRKSNKLYKHKILRNFSFGHSYNGLMHFQPTHKSSKISHCDRRIHAALDISLRTASVLLETKIRNNRHNKLD